MKLKTDYQSDLKLWLVYILTFIFPFMQNDYFYYKK